MKNKMLSTEEMINIIQELRQEVKELEDIRVKAIEMFESGEHFEDGCYCEEIEKLLKGDSNEYKR